MLYIEILQRFREVSGRYDLVSVAGADTGGGHYVNTGLKWLDQHVDRYGAEQNAVCELVENHTDRYYTSLAIVRTVSLSYVDGTNYNYFTLERVTHLQMNELKNTVVTAGRPLYWAYTPLEVGPPDGLYITVNPPADTVYTYVLTASGKPFMPAMGNEGTTNYWSVHHPELLVWAACYCLEVAYRNSEGAKDWLNSIEQYLFDVEKEYVDGQLQESLILEG